MSAIKCYKNGQEKTETYVSRRICTKVEEELQESKTDHEGHRRKLVKLSSQDTNYSQQPKISIPRKSDLNLQQKTLLDVRKRAAIKNP